MYSSFPCVSSVLSGSHLLLNEPQHTLGTNLACTLGTETDMHMAYSEYFTYVVPSNLPISKQSNCLDMHFLPFGYILFVCHGHHVVNALLELRIEMYAPSRPH